MDIVKVFGNGFQSIKKTWLSFACLSVAGRTTAVAITCTSANCIFCHMNLPPL